MDNIRKNRAIVSTNHIDNHGDQISIEVLEQMVHLINDSQQRIRLGTDHRRDLPPKGRLENAVLRKDGDDYLVEADLCEFENIEPVDWDKALLKESFLDSFQFVEVEKESCDGISISIDVHNFKSIDDYNNCINSIENNENIRFEEHVRKALLPDPEIVFQLAQSYLLCHFLKPVACKLGEKLAVSTTDYALKESKRVMNMINSALREFLFRCIPSTRPANIIFDYPGTPHIELIARTRDKDLVLNALNSHQLSKVGKKITDLSKHINIAKVQFVLSNKGKWKFNYLLTDKGEVIGTKTVFKKRDKKIEMINRNAIRLGRPIAVSCGATGVITDRKKF